MTYPAFIFGSILALLIGSLFHIWKNGGLGKYFIYCFSSFSGFWIGHAVGGAANINFWKVGPTRIGVALIGSIIFLFLAHWLTNIKQS
ncbi:MAG: hypothetical protein JEZ06_18110 [Anaerolineaceae bacterium]|nr:hypothetical protein [Anaerolineaceae bacterium]